MNCHRCVIPGVAWIGKLLLCGPCYLEWATALVAEKRQDSYLDSVQKAKRVRRKSA